nr:DUF1349 domain-containing protein [Enterococcus sulfureus]
MVSDYLSTRIQIEKKIPHINREVFFTIEYETENVQHLGSIVTNRGYSDWAMTVIDASITEIWYRFSRRQADFYIESSFDGLHFTQMRICHMELE